MKFICNIPLNVTKYINKVKKKVKSIRKLEKLHSLHSYAAKETQHLIHVCVQRNV